MSTEQQPVIGINWKGNRKDLIKSSRNVPIEYFTKTTSNTKATFLSLQRDSQSSELKKILSDRNAFKFQDEINRIADSDDPEDFLEYAAIITNCDLVITTDTTVAHIASGMGIPTWVLLQKTPEWRWGLEGDTSFWYPTMRLFRQKDRGEWEEVMERVAEELEEYFGGHKQLS